MLKVVVQKASNLPNVERFGKSDPYAKISFQGTEQKTEHIDNTLDPEWTEKNDFTFELTRPLSNDDKLDVIVKDHDTIGSHKTLGTVTVPLRDLVKSKKLDNSYDLVDGKGRPSLAKIFLQMEYDSPDKEEKKGGGGDAGGSGGASTGGGGGGGGGGEEGYEDDDDDGGGGGIKRIRRRKSRRKLSDKPQDFQIRIKIMEARNLPGKNIHPVVRVTVSNQRRETKVRSSTTKPIFNESFTFNFHTSEAELFDDLVSFEVFNSIKFRSDALLASFEMDIASIFDMDDHAFVRKWILLSEPVETEVKGGKKSKDGEGGGAPAGYLKATAMILGPGDKPPLSASAPPKDDEDDIEANVLMPFGVERQPAIFNLKIYRAEDVPQMDTGVGQSIKKFFSFSFFGSKDKDKEDKESSKTKLVDPYAMFSFSGKEVKTDTKYGKDTPLFNTVLRLPLQFPSMCERLKVQLWDWDRGSQDDIISTAFILLSSISGHGDEGFLPQFGPCYVNFYGSPREFSVLPDENEDLNKGVGEGVAYRGRALVELETTLGEVIEEPVGVIQGEEIIRAEAFRTRDEYKLFACFYKATMVSETDGPVEFEVSIGNYGNMMDESVAPSNTPPTNAVYDGCHYYYLPWFQEKPCVCVTSFWEDIAHRLEPLNVINRRFERLQTSFERVKKEIEMKEPAKKEKKTQSSEQLPGREDRRLTMLSSLLDNFVNEFSKPLPDAKGRKNKLDNRMKALREKELNALVRDVNKQQAKLLLPEIQSTMDETIKNLVTEMEDYLQRLKDLAFEPQNSMPDVILWMICGSKRIAYYRIPAYDLLFSRHEDASGKLCGTTEEIRLKYPGKKAYDIKDHPEVPAVLRIEMWLGKTADQVNWTDRKGNGDFALYAETYQNQTRLIPMTDFKDSSMFRPNWSNANGTIEMKKENFQAPANWNIDVNNWKLSPELSLKFDSDAGHKTFLEEVYETQTRMIPGGNWPQDKVKWVNVHGDELTIKSLKEIQCPKGWQWKQPEKDWTVDKNRAVDNDGWEYALDPSLAAYDPVQKAYHLSRRRRFVRKRKLVDKDAAKKRDHINAFEKEGWAYAPTFDGKFHAKTRNADFVRRRRYLNKLTPKGGAIKEFPPILRVKLKGKVKDQDTESQPNVWPRMFVTFQTPMKFQLWVYIYQARDLPALDDSGMSDPYVRVAFGNQSLATKTHYKCLCPTWDRSLVFENVAIYESLANLEKNPPSVVLEVFDEDPVGKDDFLGRCMLKPVIKKDGFKAPQPGDPQEPRLLWQQLKKGEDEAGEVLASCELFWIKDATTELPQVPSKGKVRDGVRPIRQWSAIEVLCWGVRNMKKFQLTNVSSPSVEFECNGELMVSEPIKNTKKNPNFKQPTLERKIVKLPVDPMYLPPVNIRVRDNRTFGRKPIVGVYSVKSLANFRCQRPAQPDVITVEVDGGTPPTPPRSGSTSESLPRTPTGRKSVSTPPETPDLRTVDITTTAALHEDEEFDWWSKFYASDFGQDKSDAAPAPVPETSEAPKIFQFLTSSGEEKKADHLELYRMGGFDTMQIYKQELETVEGYEGFQDFVSTFPIRRGKTKSKDEEEDTVVGELKGSFRIYPMPPKDSEGKFPETESVFSHVTSSKPRECVVRLYVVTASQLQPQDPSGLADPYLKVTLGKNKFDESENYKPNTLAPSFGKMFEMKATIPLEKDLKVTVMDYDMLTRDDLIGETVIDLENRLLSKYRATCGLPHTYCRKFECSGPPHRWRDIKDPYVILKDWCAAHMSGVDVKLYGSGKPSSPYRMVLGDREYSLEQFATEITPFQKSHLKGSKNRENRKQQLALFVLDQLGLVPEHVETRPLYNPLQPGMEQGKIQLWVDIFPIDEGVPGMPVYIAPRQPSVYHLRVIIWNTTDVVLEETSVTGEKMSDIYLKGWISGIDEKQKTDVHYRSLDGDGNFNWRMEFPFEYLPIEKMLVVKKKAHFFSKDVTEEHLPPVFNLQVWDNDLFSKDDFIGQRDLNLVALEKPCAKPGSCGGRNDPGLKGEKINLFKKGTINGWWALYPGEETAKKKREKAKGKKTTDEDEEEDEEPVETTGTKKNDPYQFNPLDEDKDEDERPAKRTVRKKKKPPVPSGKVEMTLELLPELDAQAKPVGKGQDDPNQYPHLDKPNRPATSFMWFTSPFKTLKYIIWRNYKWYIIGGLLLLLLIAAIAIFLYSVPGYTVKKMFGV